MMSENDSLFEWDADVSQLAQMRDRIRKHPKYGEAARRLAANLLRDAEEDPSLSALLRDAGHNVAALSAAYLNASGRGHTAASEDLHRRLRPGQSGPRAIAARLHASSRIP